MGGDKIDTKKLVQSEEFQIIQEISTEQLHTFRFYILDTIYKQTEAFGVDNILTPERKKVLESFVDQCKDDTGNNNLDYDKGRKIGQKLFEMFAFSTQQRLTLRLGSLNTLERGAVGEEIDSNAANINTLIYNLETRAVFTLSIRTKFVDLILKSDLNLDVRKKLAVETMWLG